MLVTCQACQALPQMISQLRLSLTLHCQIQPHSALTKYNVHTDLVSNNMFLRRTKGGFYSFSVAFNDGNTSHIPLQRTQVPASLAQWAERAPLVCCFLLFNLSFHCKTLFPVTWQQIKFMDDFLI